ncbi:hypothetical protein AVEN_204305-1 [Araneus ventricosus]|uniref:BACK domain-containing protein n=1 Tax=Araneus ventricosus TaxID=182803 RepID=A0A4Y2S1S5_ARAVE|nr:hypothetical protein AVEN_133040-1 [Araneus ventricosus]GBN81170.1 hypothetical protein AVEN_204305-1 [Araneus ventricosus]
MSVISERSVWEAIMSWTEANSSIRLPHVPALLTCLRLDEEVDEILAAEILSHTIVSRNPHFFCFMLSNQLSFHTLRNTILSLHECLDPVFQNSLSSYDPRIPNRLHLIAKLTESSEPWRSELFLSYDNELDFWRHIHKAYNFFKRMIVVGQRIYTYSDYDVYDYITDIEEETLIGRREDEVHMTMPSVKGWTITLGEKPYHIVGSDVSSYEFERNRWERITTFRYISIKGAVTLNNQIFIVGVHERNEFSVVGNHEQVFVVPKYSEDAHPETVEVYDPNQNTWMSLPDLPFQYRSPKAVVLNDKIIVYENNEEQSQKYQDVDPPVYWVKSARLWRIIDESSPWYHIEQYTFLALDNCRLVK